MHMISPKIRCVPYHIARGKLLHLGFHFWKHRLKTFGLIYEEKYVLSTKCTVGLKWWGLQFWVVHDNIDCKYLLFSFIGTVHFWNLLHFIFHSDNYTKSVFVDWTPFLECHPMALSWFHPGRWVTFLWSD